MEIKKGELVAIIGKSGSGKSTLVSSLLNEISFIESDNFKFFINFNFSVLMQKPWIWNETIYENILFGSPFDEIWY